jgi:hypothetical protein
MSKGKVLAVAQNHPKAGDKNRGTANAPFKTINAAAKIAKPGDTVLIREGVYRERVNPVNEGTASQPITYKGADGEAVCIRGSDVFKPKWRPVRGMKGVFRGDLTNVKFGASAYKGICDKSLYGDYNPFHHNFYRSRYACVRPISVLAADLRKRIANLKKQLKTTQDSSGEGQVSKLERVRKQLAKAQEQYAGLSNKKKMRFTQTNGMVFVDGKPMLEVETMEELANVSATYLVSADGKDLLIHFSPSHLPPEKRLVEITTRHTVFSPLKRGLGHIHVKNLTIEHGANHMPSWGRQGWPQHGILSCRSGHHWIVEKCVIRYAKGIGIDIGQEGGSEIHGEFMDSLKKSSFSKGHDANKKADKSKIGHHIIKDNHICDNGLCGLTGLRHIGSRIIGNVIERNNRTGYVSDYWEMGAVKFHFFFDGVMEGNLIRDNDGHGIWIDNQWRGSRITRNVIINNMWSGINVELGVGPVLIDNNIIAYTRQGDGVYGHDMADVMIAHNLLYANSNYGVWMAYATPRRRPQECWDINVYNNMILGNRAGAVSLPIPFAAAGRNHSDSNVLMGAGEYLDEGSGPHDPLFQINNNAHMAKMQRFLDFEAQTEDVVVRDVKKKLKKAGVPKSQWPNFNLWKKHFLVSLDMWRKVFGGDKKSRIMRVIRDGLQSRMVTLDFNFDDTPHKVKCKPIAGVDKDFYGNKLPRKNPMPGPFQKLESGHNRIVLWPVRGVETSCVLE